MADSRRPAYNISLDKALKQGGFYGTNGVWNSLVKIDGRVLRGRVEVLVLKKDKQQIFMHIKSYNRRKYRVPGGSYEKDVPNYIQAQNEVNEEARIKVKELVNTGEHYINLYQNPTPLYGSNFMWVGNYTEVYVGEYDGKYNGVIADEDKDDDMYNYGKFYNISEVYPILNDTHKKIIDSIFPLLDKGTINENMAILRESKTKPHYYPYYTPSEMSKLGVFNESNNRYSDIEDEAVEWYMEYTDSLRNPDSENWLMELQERYDNYSKDPTAENKQLILDLGWNPEVQVTLENILKASEKTKKRINKNTNEKIITIDEGFIFSSRDIVLNIDDFESGKSNILFVTGLAGSGKSTLAGTLQEQYDADIIQLDYFQHYKKFSSNHAYKEYRNFTDYKLIDKYMMENPDIKRKSEQFSNINLEEFADYFIPFFGWLVNNLKKDRNKKYIVEGIHILLFIPYKSVKDYPLYCVNTSAIKSLVRHWKRDDWTIHDIIKHGYGDLIMFKEWNDQYNRFKKSMNGGFIEESAIYDPLFSEEIKSPFVENDFVYTANMIQSKLKKYHQEGKYMCIECRDVESDDDGWVFAQYTISDKDKDPVYVINFINEMNNLMNNSILVGEIETPEYIKEKGFLILSDSKKFLGESTILDESLLKDTEDFYYNMDKIDNGTNKVIYVTGHSGAGKSTLRKELSEKYHNLIGISGDHITMAILYNLSNSIPDKWDLNKSKVKDKIGSIVYDYMTINQQWKNISLTGNKSKDFDNSEIAQYFYDFIMWLEKESKKSKYNNSIFIVEGLQILTIPNLDFYKDKSLIIKGTSALTSYVRKQKRDVFEDISKISWDKIKNSMIGMIPKYIGYNKDINSLQKIMNESEILQESKKGYYRVTFHNTGIYEALKRILTKEEWSSLLTDPGITWLPKPPKYAEGYVSYFTAYGYKMFEMYTYPLIEKYFDDDISVVQINTLDADIVYKDKFQVVVDTSITEACKNVDEARKFVRDVDKLAKKYNANYFIVTDGASGTRNGIYGNKVPNDAVRNARNAQKEWENKNGFDPDEDWNHESSYFPNTKYMNEGFFNKKNDKPEPVKLDLDEIKKAKSKIDMKLKSIVVKYNSSSELKNKIRKAIDGEIKKCQNDGFTSDDLNDEFYPYYKNKTKIPRMICEKDYEADDYLSYVLWKDETQFVNIALSSITHEVIEILEKDRELMKFSCIKEYGDASGDEGILEIKFGQSVKESNIYYNGEYIEEGYVKNMKDIYYNKEKFDSGEINLCFITGHSGSGKSTMGRNMSGDNIEHYELDDVVMNKANFTMENFKEYGDLIYSFFNGPGKKYYLDIEDLKIKFKNKWYEKEIIKDFVKYSKSFAESHKDTKFVIEGIWLFMFMEPLELKDYAVYIKGTSALISRIRAIKRDWKNDKNNSKSFIQRAKLLLSRLGDDILDARSFEKKIQNYRNYFSRISMNESSVDDDKEYGLPSLKKYPMPDEKHVLSAIRFFNYVSPANEKELAMNIKKKMKQYNIPPSKVGDKNRLKKYLKEDVDLVQELQYYSMYPTVKPILVFDIGSVLVDSKVSYLDSLYKSSLIPNNFAQKIHDYIMDTYKDNSEYLSYCTTREYYKFMTDKAPEELKKYIPAAIKINIDSLKKLPYVDSLLKKLKERGYTLCYLSNWDKWSRDELVRNDTFDFLKYFNKGVFSCDVKCSKPDHKIYEKFFDICHTIPNYSIFFDDNPDNIRAAMEVGMYGILFNKDYTPQWICDMFLSGEPIEELCYILNEAATYNIEKTKDTYMIKNEKGEVISKIRFFDYNMNNFDWVLIADVDTNPQYRKIGLASKLLNEIYKDVRKESSNTKGIYVFVRQNNKNAIALYEKLKFKIIKEYKLSDGDYFIMAKGSADRKQFDNMNFK